MANLDNLTLTANGTLYYDLYLAVFLAFSLTHFLKGIVVISYEIVFYLVVYIIHVEIKP